MKFFSIDIHFALSFEINFYTLQHLNLTYYRLKILQKFDQLLVPNFLYQHLRVF